MIRLYASALFVGLMAPWASAQTAPAPATPQPPAAQVDSLSAPLPTDPAHPNYHAGAHKSIIRHNPLPRRTSYNSHYPYTSTDTSRQSAGFSTGGVGRYGEYYDANTPTGQVDQHPVPVARFDSGGGPDRNEQIAAAQAGQVRARNIQNNINAYGTPYGAYGAGFGYGLGLGGGGRLYGFPN